MKMYGGEMGGTMGFVLGRRAIIDVPTALIFVGTLAVLSLWKKAPEPLVIVKTGVAGIAIKALS